jgi:hypothetical protein
VRRLISLLAVLAPVACRTVVDVPDAPPPWPVVEGLLTADSASTVFHLIWSSPPTAFPTDSRPIAADQVALELTGPAGRVRLTPVPDSAGYFRAALAIERGARYVLAGTIGGNPIRATTVVPARFDIVLPADTLVLTEGVATLVPFDWTAEGASAFYLRGARFRTNFGANGRATSGELLVEPPATPGNVTFEVSAITREADQYLFSPQFTPRSNVEGGFGYLGGAISVRRVIRWE